MKKISLKPIIVKTKGLALLLYTLTLAVSIANAQETVTDIDGNEYDVITIGTLKWTKQNLKVTKYKNGDAIATGLTNTQWKDATSGAYAYPNGDAANVGTFGLLYNAFVIADSRGLAPEGWRVATDADWRAMELEIGISSATVSSTGWRGAVVEDTYPGAGNKLKSIDFPVATDADGKSTAGTNDHCFSVMAAGVRLASTGAYNNFTSTQWGAFWTSSASGTENYFRRVFAVNQTGINRSAATKKEGYSIRLVQDLTVQPVVLQSFNVKPDGAGKVSISWTTASETNNDYFEVEKAADGKEFVAIDKINGAGTTNEVRSYHIEDTNPFEGINYYRLKQIDRNGTMTIYEPKSVNAGSFATSKVKVYPNPASDKVFLYINASVAEKVDVSIVNAAGKLVHTETISVQAGNNNYQLNINKQLVAGAYVIKVAGSEISETAKLLIQ